MSNATDITLDTPTSGGPPSASFAAPGSWATVGIVNVDDYQQRDFDTGEPEFWDDGKPKMGKVVTALVVDSNGVTVGSDEDTTDVQPGDIVSFWCEGGKHFTWRDAVKAAGGVKLGDVMRWERGEDEPPKKRGFNPRKTYSARIRRAEAKDGDLADRCFAAYQDTKDRPVLEQPATRSADTEPEPF